MVKQEHTATGPLLGGLAVIPRRARLLLIGATLGYAAAGHRFAQLNGWADNDWNRNQQNAIRAAKQFLDEFEEDDLS